MTIKHVALVFGLKWQFLIWRKWLLLINRIQMMAASFIRMNQTFLHESCRHENIMTEVGGYKSEVEFKTQRQQNQTGVCYLF